MPRWTITDISDHTKLPVSKLRRLRLEGNFPEPLWRVKGEPGRGQRYDDQAVRRWFAAYSQDNPIPCSDREGEALLPGDVVYFAYRGRLQEGVVKKALSRTQVVIDWGRGPTKRNPKDVLRT